MGSSYIDDTSPDPWHQIIVISQKVINDSFGQMYGKAKLQGDSPMVHYKERLRTGTVDIHLKAPRIELQVTTKDPQLYYYLIINSGTISIYKDEVGDDMRDLDAAGTTLVFPVNIGRKTVDKNSDEYNEFKGRASLPDSVFTLQRLYIDTSSSTKLDMPKSTLGPDWQNLNASERASIDGLIQRWINIAAEKGENILGYSAQAQDQDDEMNKYAPTFPPTSIDYATYPWSENSPKDGADNNGLAYLMMTDFQSAPSGYNLPFTGHWVDGSDATFCMNQQLFWLWMLPVFKEVAVGMTAVPDPPQIWYSGDKDFPFGNSFPFHWGDANYESFDYEFKKQSATEWTWEARMNGTTGEQKLVTDTTFTNPNDSNDSMEAIERSLYKQGSVTFVPGKEQIVLTGKGDFYLELHHWSKKNKKWEANYETSWSLTLAVASVDDGGLIFKEVDRSTSVDYNVDADSDLKFSEGDGSSFAADMEGTIGGQLDNALSQVEFKLLNALRDQHRLFLPGAGSFLMKDPKFNARGDLMVKLSYNGADPPKRSPN